MVPRPGTAVKAYQIQDQTYVITPVSPDVGSQINALGVNAPWRGAPAVSNILQLLQRIQDGKLFDEVMEDARAALEAAERVRTA